MTTNEAIITSDNYKQYCETVKYRFGGRCPYTDLKCATFNCAFCEVEKQEHQWLEDLTTKGDEV